MPDVRVAVLRAPADGFFSSGLLLRWEVILAAGALQDELLSVPYSDALGSCSTDSDSFVGMHDCPKAWAKV